MFFAMAFSSPDNAECVFLDDPSRDVFQNRAHICWPDQFDNPGFSFSAIGDDDDLPWNLPWSFQELSVLEDESVDHDHYTAKRCLQLWSDTVHFCFPPRLYDFEYHVNGIPESWTDSDGEDLSEYCMEIGFGSDNYLCGIPTRHYSSVLQLDIVACDICPLGYESNPGSDRCQPRFS